MATTHVPSPTSRLLFGYAKHDITPPMGIYHRMWGAARHDVATGIHRPLECDLLIFEPINGDPINRHIRIQLDFVYLNNSQLDKLGAPAASIAKIPPENVVITCSHSHSAGVFESNRYELPGGNLIEPYLNDVAKTIGELTSKALANLSPATFTYSAGHCGMASNRDFYDETNKLYATGHNPNKIIENPLTVVRVCSETETPVLYIVHYGCHPTTLSWDNSLISPDFIGSLRETIQEVTGSLCCYFQAPCGDIGPREGFVGDPTVADRNGKQVAHAALSLIYSLGSPNHDFHYSGPVISGATIGTWKWQPHNSERSTTCSRFSTLYNDVFLPIKKLPTKDQLEKDILDLNKKQAEADKENDIISARDYGARAERCRRWLSRISRIPKNSDFKLKYGIQLLGDALWITVAAEPYSNIAVDLRRRFPDFQLIISPISGDAQVAYLLPKDRYGIGLYQEEPSALAPGCLELLTDAITKSITELTGYQPSLERKITL